MELSPLPNGVPAGCVEYRGVFDAVVACDDVPENAREGLKQSYVAIQRSWSDAASMTASQLRSLDNACGQATDALRRLASTQCTLPPHLENPIKAATSLPPACYRYKRTIDAMYACDKLPQQSRDAIKQSYEAMAQGWSGMPELTPELIQQMEVGCRAGDDAIHQAFGQTCDLSAPPVEAMPAESNVDLPSECQAYRQALLRLAKCDKLPKQSRDALMEGFRAMELGWKDVGSIPAEARRAINDACKQGTDALRQFAATSCGWDE